MWWGPSRNLTNKNSAGARACAQVMGNFNQVQKGQGARTCALRAQVMGNFN